jgi:hypothetical protein
VPSLRPGNISLVMTADNRHPGFVVQRGRAGQRQSIKRLHSFIFVDCRHNYTLQRHKLVSQALPTFGRIVIPEVEDPHQRRDFSIAPSPAFIVRPCSHVGQ